MVISCELNAIPKLDLSVWKDEELSIEFPITRDTLGKVIDLAKFNVEERNRREKLNVAQNQKVFQKGDPLFAYGNMMRSKQETKHFSKVC